MLTDFPLRCVLAGATILLLTACHPDASENRPDGQTQPQTGSMLDEDTRLGPVLQGQFIDAPVAGVAVSRNGGDPSLTDAEGRFDFRPGETLRFQIGGIALGEADGAEALYPADLQGGNPQGASNLSRFLLTLDADEDATNGIQITSDVRTAAAARAISASAFAVPAADFANTALADFARHANGDSPRTLRSAADAAAERRCTEIDMADGQYDGDCDRGLPRVDAGSPQTVDEGQTVRLQGTAVAQQGRSVQQLRWQQIAGPAVISPSATDQNQWQFIAPQVDTAQTLRFRLTAIDSAGFTASASVLVQVNNVLPNQVPVASISAPATVRSLESVALTAEATDADGDITALRRQLQAAPPRTKLEDLGNGSARLQAPNVADEYTLSVALEAQDDDGAITVALAAIRVLPLENNQPPSILDAYADPGVAYAGESVSLRGVAEDADGHALDYRWRQLENGSPILQLNDAQMATALTEVPALDSAAAIEFELTVSDGAAHAHQAVPLQALPSDQPPPSTEACLTAPTRYGCPLWTFRDMLADDAFASCSEDPYSKTCPLHVLADADPGIAACLQSPSQAGCAAIVNNVFDPSFISEKIPPDAPATSCNPAYDPRSFEHYVGTWHEHTGYSDGTWGQRPLDMFEQVKARGFSWAGSSEHSDTLDPGNPAAVPRDCSSSNPVECQIGDVQEPANNVRKWAAIAEQASAASDEHFTALRGFEWTSDRFGHINVFFSEHVINAKTEAGYAVSLSRFWQWFQYPAAFGGGSDAILSFNHPGREDTIEGFLHDDLQGGIEDNLFELPTDLHDPTYTFNDFRHVPGADYRAVAVEVFGKGSEYDSGGRGGSWLSYALDQGWHLGPMASEDHHGTDWGGDDLPKTVAIARSVAPADLKEALLARRFYAVAQHYNDVQLIYTIDDEPMGARLRRPVGTSLDVQVSVHRAGEPFAAVVEMVTAGNTIAQTLEGSRVTTAVSVSDTERYYFLRVREPATGRPIAFSAPIWLLPGNTPLPACPQGGQPPN